MAIEAHINLYETQLKAVKLLKEARELIERAHKLQFVTGYTFGMWIQEYQDAGFEGECERYDNLHVDTIIERHNAARALCLGFGWSWARPQKLILERVDHARAKKEKP